MDKLKNFFKITVTNKTAWITFVVAMLIIIFFTATTVGVINYKKSKEAIANADTENMIKQENLIDTSQMSEEELKKLNEEEVKEEEEKQKEEKKKNTTTTKTTKSKYYIKVNYGAQTVTIYTYDKNGNYTVPVRACICSTGAATPTSGVYKISWKATWGLLYGNVWGHYCCRVVGDILFHSVPYKQNQNDTLVSAYYDKLGSKDSMGCIRLTTIDAKWIFDNCPSGTEVEFYSSSNPGPLGKPTAIKVSNAPENLKNWDPTDPDPKNPWIDYLKKQEQEKANQNKTNNTVNNTQENKTTENTNTEVVNNETGGTTTGGNSESQGETTGGSSTTGTGHTTGENQNSETTGGNQNSDNTETTGGNTETSEPSGGKQETGKNEETEGQETTEENENKSETSSENQEDASGKSENNENN